MLENSFKNLGCCYLAAGDFAKAIETSTQVFAQKVAAKAGCQTVKDTGDTVVSSEERVIVTG